MFRSRPAAATALLVTATAFSAASAHAAVMISAEDDSFLKRSDAGSVVHGLEPSLLVKEDNGANVNDRVAFIDFNLSSITADVANARIDLVVINPGVSGTDTDAFRLEFVADGNANENIDEATFSKGTTTIEDGSDDLIVNDDIGGFIGNFTLSASSTTATVDTVELVDAINSDTNGVLTLVLRRTSNNSSVASFASRNNSTLAAPTLTLTLVPEPASLALLGLGTLCLLGRRTR